MNEETKKESETYFEDMRKKQIEKLTNVGFTKEQAEVLLDMMQQKAFCGGLF